MSEHLFTEDRDLLLEFTGWLAENHSGDIYYVLDWSDRGVEVVEDFLREYDAGRVEERETRP